MKNDLGRYWGLHICVNIHIKTKPTRTSFLEKPQKEGMKMRKSYRIGGKRMGDGLTTK